MPDNKENKKIKKLLTESPLLAISHGFITVGHYLHHSDLKADELVSRETISLSVGLLRHYWERQETIHCQDRYTRNNALHFVALTDPTKYNTRSITTYLLSLEEHLEPETFKQFILHQNADGDTPLHLAILHHREIAANLLQNQVVIDFGLNIPNKKGQTPLIVAIKNQNDEITKVILSHKADRKIADENKNTPLHHAVMKQNDMIAEQLLQPLSPRDKRTSVKLDSQNVYGNTPLHLAARAGLGNMIELLVNHNAGFHILNNQKQNPLDAALIACKENVIERLVMAKKCIAGNEFSQDRLAATHDPLHQHKEDVEIAIDDLLVTLANKKRYAVESMNNRCTETYKLYQLLRKNYKTYPQFREAIHNYLETLQSESFFGKKNPIRDIFTDRLFVRWDCDFRNPQTSPSPSQPSRVAGQLTTVTA